MFLQKISNFYLKNLNFSCYYCSIELDFPKTKMGGNNRLLSVIIELKKDGQMIACNRSKRFKIDCDL